MFSWARPFIFKSKPFDWNDTIYYHQLTEGFSFVPQHQDMTEVYEEFNTLAHVTNFESLGQIFEDGCIKHHYVKDSSVSNPDRVLYSLNDAKAIVGLHPLARSKIVWYGTYTKQRARNQMESVERYGNVMFTMDKLTGYGGILNGSYNYYFVEVVHYRTQTATRILVTNKEYPNLKKYDPYKEGGPWYYDRQNGKHWCLTSAIHFSLKREVKNTLEFMKDESLLDFQSKIWLENHELSHKICYSPRKGVRVTSNTDESVLRLVLGTMAYKLAQQNPAQAKAKMPKCTEFVKLSTTGYARVRHLLGQLRSRCIANQGARRALSVVVDSIQENAQNSILSVGNGIDDDAQNSSSEVDNGDQDHDGAETLLETMLRSTYGDIGSQLLKMKMILGTNASFQSISIAKVTDTLLTFFRQEFFKLEVPLADTFKVIMKFLDPSGVSMFFDLLENMIDDSMPREGKEQSN